MCTKKKDLKRYTPNVNWLNEWWDWVTWCFYFYAYFFQQKNGLSQTVTQEHFPSKICKVKTKRRNIWVKPQETCIIIRWLSWAPVYMGKYWTPLTSMVNTMNGIPSHSEAAELAGSKNLTLKRSSTSKLTLVSQWHCLQTRGWKARAMVFSSHLPILYHCPHASKPSKDARIGHWSFPRSAPGTAWP